MSNEARVPGRLAFIGFGEAAQAFLAGWRSEAEVTAAAYDIKTDAPATRESKLADYRGHEVTAAESATAAVDGAAWVLSAVTADATLTAAESVVKGLAPGALYLDINSASPMTKRKAAEAIGRAGGLYVDVAVMAPVHPRRHRTPVLISGPGANEAEDLMRSLGMSFERLSDRVGEASGVKMIRSVLVKGFEALMTESVIAAVKEGVDVRILSSLGNVYPGIDLAKAAGYMLERVVVHGRRRAAEMREVRATLDELGIGGIMADAIARRQDWLADLGLADEFPDGVPEDYRKIAEAALRRLKRTNPPSQGG
jgi:3-hydroxyisobutyrate dehydrogenase-like beta-hydroxyacid dehydrogenase